MRRWPRPHRTFGFLSFLLFPSIASSYEDEAFQKAGPTSPSTLDQLVRPPPLIHSARLASRAIFRKFSRKRTRSSPTGNVHRYSGNHLGCFVRTWATIFPQLMPLSWAWRIIRPCFSRILLGRRLRREIRRLSLVSNATSFPATWQRPFTMPTSCSTIAFGSTTYPADSRGPLLVSIARMNSDRSESFRLRITFKTSATRMLDIPTSPRGWCADSALPPHSPS
jgi:hypothetical protein